MRAFDEPARQILSIVREPIARMIREDSGSYRRARILIMSGRYKEARNELKKVLRRNPRDVDALYQMARLRMEMGNGLKARKVFGRCARLDARGKWSREIVGHLKRAE